ncbi:ribulose-phosphate 3-epimerase [uncultured Sphaerochaeta sp.]|uniref:ribulose-phosphate 3-epimerase n=1 Tax=uncultured Sphaerochaeta sp. TaxID=886478 RepID=UPI0029C9CB4B|nr:ribulose-phosphate 3-epimerase [uncultured Sphaerochaeta sp.]
METASLRIAPSMLSADFSRTAEEVQSINDSKADWVHLDVMDGIFVPNITFGPKFIQDLRPHSDLVFDVHLMIDKPERYISLFAESGSDYITVHGEASLHLHRTLQMIKASGCKAGVSLIPSTPVSMIEPILDMVDLILVMTVNPGFGGQSLIISTLQKIERLAELREQHGYDYLISVDGGVNLDTVGEIAKRKADIAVCGSAFFGAPDRVAFIQAIKERAQV